VAADLLRLADDSLKHSLGSTRSYHLYCLGTHCTCNYDLLKSCLPNRKHPEPILNGKAWTSTKGFFGKHVEKRSLLAPPRKTCISQVVGITKLHYKLDPKVLST
jgi:hypothetical protein